MKTQKLKEMDKPSDILLAYANGFLEHFSQVFSELTIEMLIYKLSYIDVRTEAEAKPEPIIIFKKQKYDDAIIVVSSNQLVFYCDPISTMDVHIMYRRQRRIGLYLTRYDFDYPDPNLIQQVDRAILKHFYQESDRATKTQKLVNH